MNAIALPSTVFDLIEEYETKALNVEQAIAALEAAQTAFDMGCTVQGTYADRVVNHGIAHASTMRRNLLKSGWRAVYSRLRIADIATAKDKQLFDRTMANPPPLTLDNAKATFIDYLVNPRDHILRGLAEVFCALDPAYKSHSKVKIGVQGLPKRIIVTGFANYSSHGENQLRDIVNALASYQGKPHIEWGELRKVKDAAFSSQGQFAMDGTYDLPSTRGEDEPKRAVDRGITVRGYQNGNAHVIFDKTALLDINRALAEFYGDVLPDVEEDGLPRQTSTAVSKDLQFYWTPPAVVNAALEYADVWSDQQYSGKRPELRILEPSCGDGRIMDEIRVRGYRVLGIEFDAGRAAECKAKGHSVVRSNFLEQRAVEEFDRVVMNPPFYGKHYAKHVRHAFKFLKPGGTLVAILPATARYDHNELNDLIPMTRWCNESPWKDLPVASFAEAGTNVPTTMLRLHKSLAN
jgi:Domain of unknown function (DUF4942)/Methyltransferase small domain